MAIISTTSESAHNPKVINLFSEVNGRRVKTVISSKNYFNLMEKMYQSSLFTQQNHEINNGEFKDHNTQRYWGFSFGYELSIPLIFKYSHDIGILFNFQ